MSALAAALGHHGEARLVIPHLDDVGMCHGANLAFFELSRGGFITCGSVMVPCPWFREAAEAAAAVGVALDLGVHLTLTSEWRHYRWGPISTVSPASGLVDGDGYFWRSVAELRSRLVVEAAEAELRAQLERALAAGIDVTHLDAHMGATLVPELLPVYLRLGRDHALPVLLPRDIGSCLEVLELGALDRAAYGPAITALNAAGAPLVDRFRMTPGAAPGTAAVVYGALIDDLPPGVTFLSLHANAPGDIEAIDPARAHHRTEEYALMQGPSLGHRAEAAGVLRIGMRPLRQLLRAGTERRAATRG